MFKITVKVLALVASLSGATLAHAEEKAAMQPMHAASGAHGKALHGKAMGKHATTVQGGSMSKGDERSIPGGPKVGPRGKDDLGAHKLDQQLDLKPSK